MPKVNPQILIWAREGAGLSLDDAARALGLAGENGALRLGEMEIGARDPSRPQLLKMAERYRRPLLTFYLASPPTAAARTHDFRTLPQREAGSEAIVDALLRDVKLRQTLVRDALEDADEAAVLPFVGSVDPLAGPEVLAEAMTKVLAFDRDEYRAARTLDQAFAILRDAVEAVGVYVILMGNLGHFTSNLSPGVFRGLALADPIAPFIVINENDSRSAWPFTLLHEFGHVLLGQSAISGYDSDQAMERLCDDAAANFLVDRAELKLIGNVGQNLDDLIAAIGDFARTRKVSRKMVAYNLLRAQFIGPALYRQIAARFDEDRLEFPNRAANGAPDYYVVRRHRVGTGLVNLVGRLVSGGTLTSTKAGKVLGVKPTAVGRMTERVA